MGNLKGKSIKLFLVDGTPQGIMTLEVMNWTGHVLMGPRTKITELVQRPEMSRTGIYFLTGSDPEGSYRPYVYIGESDVVGKRLTQHNKDETKDFWDRACIITSKDQNLTKAHVRYLESRFIFITQETGHAKLFNSTSPIKEGLPEADISDMDYFIEQVRLILPVLGLEFLKDKPQISKTYLTSEIVETLVELNSGTSGVSDNPIFEIYSRKDDIRALAKEIEGEFVVFSGSETRGQWKTSGHNYQKLFDTLVLEGKIQIDSSLNRGKFQEDVAFSSPSSAAAMIFGRAANGRTEWKLKGTSRSYESWQNEQLGKAPITGIILGN